MSAVHSRRLAHVHQSRGQHAGAAARGFRGADNDFVTILGPSGCGKSTMLRIVAGLDRPAGARAARRAAGQGPGADRGMVFQSYTLFPWLTIEQNIRFGLRERGMSEAAQKERSDYFIAKVGLRGFEHHFPKQLSGGMQQRTAIARRWPTIPRSCSWTSPSARSTTRPAC
jgi:ABC-type nitrate/sulfonate/bicarbonate transport system ATPase subunit